MEILKTNKYYMFDIEVNKPLDERHLKKLKKAIVEKDLGEHFPIDVIVKDGKLMVVNGQHRFRVRKDLGLVIYYKITNLTLEEIRSAETNTKDWTKSDYVHYYAKMGVSSYILLQRLEDIFQMKFGGYSSTLFTISTDKFNKGEFVFNEKDFDRVSKILRLYLDLVEIFPFKPDKKVLIAALRYVLTVDGFDREYFISKIKINKSLLSPAILSDQYLEQFEKIYNYRNQGKKLLLRKIK
ncbi:ParB/Srx family N-terminal domain-containing protein [Arcicella sp. LKC2W]|uniref:ParB/Srx family N-terminal domain-containing protein n=1 Tax=Arcicella sp. LKC2W TaxID=2984198 RepID=UPI002B1FF33C|nr:ParB/Srx family N-terminal domain-containing protein [Arcicella sp. LKC2W]MEA5461588.1 ParB/Srx family N-terminal domain-containing protein [Arcicella sp. LKC2W]